MRAVGAPELPTDGTFLPEAIDDSRLHSDPKSHFGGNPKTAGIARHGTQLMDADNQASLGMYGLNEVCCRCTNPTRCWISLTRRFCLGLMRIRSTVFLSLPHRTPRTIQQAIDSFHTRVCGSDSVACRQGSSPMQYDDVGANANSQSASDVGSVGYTMIEVRFLPRSATRCARSVSVTGRLSGPVRALGCGCTYGCE
jgi:hypothetical protein